MGAVAVRGGFMQVDATSALRPRLPSLTAAGIAALEPYV